MKAVSLISGGLDSTLATYLVKQQGIEVIGVNFRTPFCACPAARRGGCAGKEAQKFLKIPLKLIFIGEEMLKIVKNPRFGYGQGLNPCIDCKILMLRKAKKIMEEEGAEFVITGEVLGQRPMSQKREIMELIERESGLEGRILRPLCTRHLPPTIPEREGWVRREELLDIQGRSRKVQMMLAEKIGLKEYPSPAGGCLLTDPTFSRRMRDLMENNPEFGLREVELLKLGRHFRLSSGIKAVVGRNEEENEKIERLRVPEEVVLQVEGGKGAVVLLEARAEKGDMEEGGKLAAFYSKKREDREVKVLWNKGKERGEVVVEPEKVGRMI